MIDEKAVTRGALGSRPFLHQAQKLSDVQCKLSLRLHHTRILEHIPSYAIKIYSTVVQMLKEHLMPLQLT